MGLALPDVEATIKHDGSPVLKVDGMFMAGLAMHPSAEPDTLVVRARLEDREGLVELCGLASSKSLIHRPRFYIN